MTLWLVRTRFRITRGPNRGWFRVTEWRVRGRGEHAERLAMIGTATKFYQTEGARLTGSKGGHINTIDRRKVDIDHIPERTYLQFVTTRTYPGPPQSQPPKGNTPWQPPPPTSFSSTPPLRLVR